MNQQNLIRNNVTSVVCKTLTLESIKFEEDLFDTGLLDSLSMVQLMVALEEEFSIRIEPEDLDFEDYRSVKSMTEMINRIFCVIKLKNYA
jgi:methoxymalonate biosynthesis acyl carrier protein